MSTAVLLITVVITAGLLTVLAGVLAFNGLIRKRNRTDEAWSQIDVQLKRRHDLIPNLVQTVKGYAAHERGTFEAVTAARAAAMHTGTDPGAVAAAEDRVQRSLASLFAVAENYPALRAQDGFLALQEQLATTEDKLEYARRYYNASVRDFNTAIQSFPGTVLAAPMGMHRYVYFEVDTDDRAVPTVDFTTPTRPAHPTTA